ncbi:MAG: hypothetical protein AB7U83_02815 [Vicinamibacterales bacterium]
MTTVVVMMAWLAAAPVQEQEKRIPSDSVEVASRGCIKGRVFTATERSAEDEGTRLGPDISGRHFRLAGPREAMDQVKKYNGQWVEMLGIVKKADLNDYQLGRKVGGGRVVIGMPRSDPTRGSIPQVPTTPVMDVTAVRFLGERCPIG